MSQERAPGKAKRWCRGGTGGFAGIRSVGSIGRQAITIMLNASLRNVSIRKTLDLPANRRRNFQSKYHYDEKRICANKYS
ncbi:MAG TPA: hypothetical protein VIE43_13075 [Thermoanaerobaculia bacterium]|nr:hypothetical protein [Thermoanaerobaculia bacterium]